jgi:hypothetical protein
LAFSADGTRLAAGSPIYSSVDAGSTWIPAAMPPELTESQTAGAFSADGQKMVIAEQYLGIYIGQSAPAPVLTIVGGSKASLSWGVPSINFGLQATSDLMIQDWIDQPMQPNLNTTNLTYEVVLPASAAASTFYRLKF